MRSFGAPYMQKAACPDTLMYSCKLLKIFAALPLKLQSLRFRKEIWQSRSMQMMFSTNTGHTEQLLQSLLSDQIVLWDVMICMLFRGANTVSSHSGCKLEFTEGKVKWTWRPEEQNSSENCPVSCGWNSHPSVGPHIQMYILWNTRRPTSHS